MFQKPFYQMCEFCLYSPVLKDQELITSLYIHIPPLLKAEQLRLHNRSS